MNRNEFLRLSSTLAAGTLFTGFARPPQTEKLKNWSGNLTYSTGNVFYPKTADEAAATVKKLSRLRSLGTRHCFNTIADSTDNLVSSRELNKVISLDADARSVTVEAGIKYGELAPYIDQKGFAVFNLASLPHISVGGSVATGTHGSGVKNPNLSTGVSALEIITASGDTVKLTRATDGEKFLGAVVGFGALGLVTKITLDLIPRFDVRQYVYQNLPVSELQQHYEEIVSAGYSVSLFTDWQTDFINEVWIKTREEDHFPAGPEFFGAKAATRNVHPIIALGAENCTDQMGVPGPWYERLPHFKMGFTPSSGKELQTEYFVPRHQAVEAIMAVARLKDEIGPHLFITELRTIAADDLWMSPARKQDSAAIHFTWKQEIPAVMALLPKIEKELARFSARPHWGKIFTLSPKVLQSRYEKLHDFKKLAHEFDPGGKFRNNFLQHNLYSA